MCRTQRALHKSCTSTFGFSKHLTYPKPFSQLSAHMELGDCYFTVCPIYRLLSSASILLCPDKAVLWWKGYSVHCYRSFAWHPISVCHSGEGKGSGSLSAVFVCVCGLPPVYSLTKEKQCIAEVCIHVCFHVFIWPVLHSTFGEHDRFRGRGLNQSPTYWWHTQLQSLYLVTLLGVNRRVYVCDTSQLWHETK